MRAALLVVATSLVACREGIEVELIVADTTTTHVQVFLASHAATPDSALAALSPQALGPTNADVAAPLVAGALYPRDIGPDGARAPFEAQVGADRRARLALEPFPAIATLPALIAVGFDQNEVITSAGVLNDADVSTTPVRLIVELTPVSHTLIDGQGPAAQVWGRAETAGGGGCVGITTAAGATQFIVSEDDPDCDGFTVAPSAGSLSNAVECAPADYQGGADTVSTLMQDMGGTCRPADTGCIDGLGQSTRFRNICFPDGLCALPCAREGIDACEAANVFQAAGSFARLICEVSYSTSGGINTMCPSDVPIVDLASLFRGAESCTEVKFATYNPQAMAFGSYDRSLVLEAGPGGLTATTAVVPLNGAGVGGCKFSVSPDAMAFTRPLTATTPVQVVAIKTNLGSQELRMPVVLTYKPLCPQALGLPPITCRFDHGAGGSLGDGIELCAQ